MSSVRVLLLAPDPTTQGRVQVLLDEHGFLVVAAPTSAQARRMLTAERFDALVVDLRGEAEMHFVGEHVLGEGGIESAGTRADGALPRLRVPVLVLVQSQEHDRMAQALALGAVDVVPSDLVGVLLVHRLAAALAMNAFARGVDQSARAGALRAAGRRKGDVLVGRSPEMLALAKQIDMIAKSDIGVAVYGETGTGKELVARTIHALSARAKRPFVVVNCTALPETLFENELFGHERGAYTGADRRQSGLLEEAAQGTLVLDEIGDLALGVQAKLLRLLQFREYKTVGGLKTLKADVRTLTTTHRDLRRAVAEGRFREDLYYRMNTLQVRVPPLRDRLEDVPLLVDHFVHQFCEREGRQALGFAPEAIRRLQRHHWPGNVRELESVVYRSLVMAPARRLLRADHLQLERQPAPGPVDFGRPFRQLKAEVVERFERQYLEQLLRRCAGSLSRAAREAQHERKSLYRLLHKYAIDPRTFRDTDD